MDQICSNIKEVVFSWIGYAQISRRLDSRGSDMLKHQGGCILVDWICSNIMEVVFSNIKEVVFLWIGYAQTSWRLYSRGSVVISGVIRVGPDRKKCGIEGEGNLCFLCKIILKQCNK